MSTGHLGQTRIDWSNFIKLRDEDTLNIIAAKCRSCQRILSSVSEKRLAAHRYTYVEYIHIFF